MTQTPPLPLAGIQVVEIGGGPLVPAAADCWPTPAPR